ncbi:SDR family oxidoreductase [Aquabacterium sp.]|uniref:SDR family oxidoreductase n=1 Tax=Aquabacterium sp. TaxID=1872578 RepID=UPI002CBA4F8B|nr:SDR family oxidoreductase [Aquabacterium sp.]HSW03782.1 SDR family oxidoreductase [Aquabacterium sp.]
MKRLQDKVVLITGGASGLGAADATLLAREGAKVIVTDISDDAGRAVAKRIGGEFMHHDVTQEADWTRVIAAVLSKHGRLDVLVNNAGICRVGDIETTTLEQYRLMAAVHGESCFIGCQQAVQVMKERGGSIINISSIAALRATPPVLAYAAAKGAIRALSLSVAGHCRDKGYPIRCNAIFPGVIDTPLVVPVVGANFPGAGQPEDVANMVLFLASDESRFVTGAEFVVDNGATARLAA